MPTQQIPAEPQTDIDDAKTDGWTVKSERDGAVVLTKANWGGWKLHAALLVFTAGLGNLAYGLYRRFIRPPRMAVSWDGDDSASNDSASNDSASNDSATAATAPGTHNGPFECRRCGDEAKYVTTKCPGCGFRGKTSGKEIRRSMLLLGLIFWPLLFVYPLIWLFSFGQQPSEGIAPFEGMSRSEWQAAAQKNR